MIANDDVLLLKLGLARDLCLLDQKVAASLREDDGAVCRYGIPAVEVYYVTNSQIRERGFRFEAIAKDLDLHAFIDLRRLVPDLGEVLALGNMNSIAAEDQHSD